MISKEKLYSENLLGRIAEELQLSDTQYRRAKAEYARIGEWLSRPESPFHGLKPNIYPQGSMALQTTVRPKNRVEYDLDVVLQLDRWGRTIKDFHGALQDELQKFARNGNGQGPTLLSRPRCVRLEYTKSFHLDVVPARLNADAGETAIDVPDKELTRWLPNNPLQYRKWFEGRCAVRKLEMAEARRQAPLPDNVDARGKPPLKCAVQLLKRRRDRWYADKLRDKDAPASIVVTTFVGHHYDGVDNIFDTLTTAAIQLQAVGENSAPTLRNPAVPTEDLLAGWAKERLKLLREFGSQLAREMNDLALGGPHAVKLLEEMFGEPVKVAYTKLAAEMKRLGDSGGLRASSTGLLGATGALVQPHTFFGE